jgi:uncharacterized YigZ family protein
MQESDSYKTIQNPSEGLYKEKGSKFLSFAYPISTEEEVKSLIANAKKKYFDARHHCYAYAIGSKREITKSSDDREPSGTAGKPILGQILSFDVTNVLIIVVRYFGGTLLGTGGLVHAYRTAAADAFQNAKIIEKTVNVQIKINFEYRVLNDVLKIIKEENVEQLEHNYDLQSTILLSVRKNISERIVERLNKLETLTIEKVNQV